MISIIVALFFLGLVFISFELLVPGGILGLAGGIAIVASWTLAFLFYGLNGGLVAMVAGLLLLALSLTVELKLLRRTKLGKGLFLDREIAGTSQRAVAAPDIVGRECEALTTLAPTGVVSLENQRYEAVSISGFIDKGTRLRVVDFDNFRVRVRKI